MHTLYWRDLESPANGEWLGLAVQVEGAHRAPSFLHLQSGGQARIRLMRGDQPLLWATQLPYHDGIWLVKSLVAASPAQASVPPIDSPTLEALRGLRGEARYKAWSRHFVEALRASPGSCLEAGRWLLRLSLAEQAPAWQPPQSHDSRERVLERWRYRSVGRDALLPDWRFYSLEKVLDDDWVQWLDWWGRDNDALIALRRVEDDEGRVKWWRKRAREGELPPVLALRLNCLDACVILDGHCRLRAGLLENVAPEILVLCAYDEQPMPVDTAQRERVLQSLAQRVDAPVRRGRRPLDSEQLNQVLLRLFDDRPWPRVLTRARAVLKEEQWCAEVRDWLTARERLDALEPIIRRVE
ncbi:hypothetical protein ACIUYH_12465 [Pseudomonas aeruginosa]|nr:hypothetical protein [Pseudomonas aeruginosa]HBP6244341.1 hypothetical protein [Pseudomonas aeruginosa]